MDAVRHLGVKEVAQFEGVNPKALLRRYERKRIILVTDPEDSRRKLIPLSVMSPSAYQAWVRADTCDALQNMNRQPDAAPAESEPRLPFAAPSQTEHTMLKAVPPSIPKRYQPYADQWARVIGGCTNGTWRRYQGQSLGGILIDNRQDYVRAQAKIEGIGVSTIHQKLSVLKDVNHNPDIPASQKMAEFWKRILPKNRPGRSGYSFFADPQNAWMGPELLSFYLNQAKLSKPHAHRLLLAEIDAKQRAWGAECIYERPTLHQSRTYLKGVDLPTLTLFREGEEAYRNKCAPCIRRRPPENSGDFSVTDQKVFDILCRDPGWRLGRIWMVNFLDVASWRRLGGAYGPAVSGDMVMEAAASMLSEACVPGHVHMDLGKEFIGKRFNGGEFRIKGERLYAETVGLWHRLGVEPVKAIGGNPQTKIIERWHSCISEFERSFSTYTGRNPQERPPRLALLEKQAREFKEGKAPAPPIPTIEQVIAGFEWWCANEWNSGHRSKGRYLQGMTPDEAWFAKRPPAGFRTLTEPELEFYTADRRFLKIGRGGEVALTIYGQTLEYFAPELFLHQGKDAEVLVSRRTLGQVTVIYPVTGGTESCTANLKREVPWGSESRPEVKLRLRCINSVKGLLKRSLRTIGAAQGVLAEAPFLPTRAMLDAMVAQQIVNPRQLFGTSTPAPPPLGHPETGSVEYMATRRRGNPTADEVADRMWEKMKEGS
ncbi:MAG: hypothetical protein ABSF45_15990 [Terriglobia bacterium]|jgi:hypothetical protein